MRIILVAAIASLLTGCMATNIKPGDEFTVEVIQEAPDAAAGEIYDAAQVWIAETFVSAEQVIELADRNQGVLIGNGIVNIDGSLGVDRPTRFKLRIDTKDGRYRTTFSDVSIEFGAFGWKRIEFANRESLEPDVEARFRELVADLAAHIASREADANW